MMQLPAIVFPPTHSTKLKSLTASPITSIIIIASELFRMCTMLLTTTLPVRM